MKFDGRTLDHQTLEHLRITAVRRVMEDGESPSEVMRSLGLCRTSIYPWLRRYNDQGLAALVEKIAHGRAPKLSDKQQQQVKGWIVGKDPRQYGFDRGLWTRRIVQSLVERKCGVRLGWTAVGRLLARLEITPQKLLRRASARDPREIQKWLNERYPQLRRRAKKQEANIYFLDEPGFHSDPVLGRRYGLPSQPAVVRTSVQPPSINAISALSAKGEFWCNRYSGNLKAARFVEFLQDFMKGRRERVFLVLDDHPSHKAELVAAYVRSLRGKLELHFLPPYAPRSLAVGKRSSGFVARWFSRCAMLAEFSLAALRQEALPGMGEAKKEWSGR